MAIIKTILVEFSLGDVEDPVIYAGEPLWRWQQSEAGKWCMEHCVETPTWTIRPDIVSWGHRVVVHGEFHEQDYTYFKLKFT